MSHFRIFRRFAAAVLASALALGTLTALPASASSAKADEIRQLLEQYHISKPTDETLDDAAIDGMIDSLNDPYTEYFSEEQMKGFSNLLEQTFVGIGIVMTEDDKIVYIEDVISGSPAQQAGLQPGDAILSVDGVSMAGKTIADVQRASQGVEGTKVKFGVKRGEQKLLFQVVRQTVHMPAASSKMMGDGVGYLDLDTFSSDAASKFAKELKQLEQQGLQSLIVDLRSNGGGYVDQAQLIASQFIDDGVLAHLLDRDGNDTPLAVQGTTKPYPVWILVNGGSASASELLSGALQDYGIAKLIGTKTYGKGVVQRLVPVPSGGTLKVTVQEYLTPNGNHVDKVGLQPDLVVEGSLEQLMAGFRAAGGRTLTLTLGKGSAVVNGVRVAQPGLVLKKNGVWYVRTKLGANVAEAMLSYDAKAKQIVLLRDSASFRASVKDGQAILVDGVSYLDVRLLAKWFGDVQWSAAGDGTVTLADTAAAA
ncbi:S41 family peptidase [Cohnella sp. REN36]|uniref:S41 family peptidase n=1 Tax=Cohnella sp. REN36 TaxID=2887347 RepID=UPI001D148A93|nr:S41 family peptidase [Cohnella sp. REN36]MCC3373210.1 S41 family peptidase [Cohnella sp. REN36]